jgi:molybdopterin molybdotransferase
MEHLQVSVAQRIVLESVATLGVDSVKLEQSLGRVLAENICANRDLPPYDVSAMDGFAVRSADVVNAPVTLEIIEDIKAGDMPTRIVQVGQCARIMTGAPLPQGADAVIRVEDTAADSAQVVHNSDTPSPLVGEGWGEGDAERSTLSLTLPPQGGGDWLRENSQPRFKGKQCWINKAVKHGNDIRLQGEGMKTGEVVLQAGTEITPGVIGILATVKAAQFAVHRRPRVAILSTGNELEGMDDPVDPNKIPDSNTYALMAQVQALGIEPTLLGIARDDPLELEQYLRRGLEYDVLLVSGGTSVGVHDYVRPTIEKLGVQMKFWRVAMKPGHPLAFGTTNKTVVFGLPGNPVSSMVCVEEFVVPALRKMMGNRRLHRRTVTARLAHDIKHQAGRTEFVRVQLTRNEEGYVASSTGTQSSGVLLSMAKADGLLIIPAESKGLAAGEQVAVQLLDGTTFQNEIGFQE